MNKAFIAICFWQSLPDLPPLGRHVPLTAFYRLVKAEKTNSQQEKPVSPIRKNLFPQNTKKTTMCFTLSK